MKRSFISDCTALFLCSVLSLLVFAAAGYAETTTLFQDDFSSGNADRWQFGPTWEVFSDEGNYVLRGSSNGQDTAFANAGSRNWQNYSFRTRVKLSDDTAAVHIIYRTIGCERYYVGFNSAGLYLHKTYPATTCTDITFQDVPGTYTPNTWYTVEIVGSAGNIKVYVDSILKIDYTDSTSPILSGAIAFEALMPSPVYLDDIVVATDEPLSPTPWVSTGGPLGGLGYDVRIHPLNKNIMYVTDNFAGVTKSTNSGQLWSQMNSGITVRGGTTGDAVNIFSLTVDPNNPETVWAGTFGEGASFGVFKSTDAGATWVSKTAGMSLDGDIGMVFRGFTIQPGLSDTVYAQAEIPTTQQGFEFNRTKGRVYKTTNGGDSWSLIWSGDSLARYLIIDPADPDILYLSTGIFDREAFNSDCALGAGSFGGLGVLKSINGGADWLPLNTGLTDLYVGSLRMHPTNNQVLFAATGSNSCSGAYHGDLQGGLFRTTDSGTTWNKVLPNAVITDREIFTTVNFSPSNPQIVYAGSGTAFYRSSDGGTTWSRHTKADGASWGSPGVRAGVPIDIVIDPLNPNLLYANNYGGGVFRSQDAAQTWENWSKGATGADIHKVHVPADNPQAVYVIGRSGPFISLNFGDDWTGICNGDPGGAFEWNAITAKPTDSNIILISDAHQGKIFRSTDKGAYFGLVATQNGADAGDPAKRQGFRTMVHSLSHPDIVYAGVAHIHIFDHQPIGTVIYKSTDAGATFSPMASGIDGNNINRLVLHPTNPDIIYAATTNGVYKSTDGAGIWTHMDSLGSRIIETLAVDFSAGYIIAGELLGGIWISSNDGTDWGGPMNSGFSSPNPYISALLFEPADTNTVYAADLYSGVYRSVDRGVNWSAYPDWMMSGLGIKAVKDLAIGADAMYASTQGGGVYRICHNLRVLPAGAAANSIQSSYAVAGETIKIQAFDFAENLDFGDPKAVKIAGGYDCGYNEPPAGYSTVAKLTVGAGSVTADRIIIK